MFGRRYGKSMQTREKDNQLKIFDVLSLFSEGSKNTLQWWILYAMELLFCHISGFVTFS
jgi:hypothetical protein